MFHKVLQSLILRATSTSQSHLRGRGGSGAALELELELRHAGLAGEVVEDVGGGADDGDAARHDAEVQAQLLVRRLLARLPGHRAEKHLGCRRRRVPLRIRGFEGLGWGSGGGEAAAAAA